jgi:hypothetical protein
MADPAQSRHLPVLTEQQGYLLAAMEWINVAAGALDNARDCITRSDGAASRRYEQALLAKQREVEEERYWLRVEWSILGRLAQVRGTRSVDETRSCPLREKLDLGRARE